MEVMKLENITEYFFLLRLHEILGEVECATLWLLTAPLGEGHRFNRGGAN